MSTVVRLLFNVSLLLLLVTLHEVMAEAQWRANQRSHELSVLNDAQMQAMCQKTNILQIRRLLDPILVPRVVESATHKKVGMYLKRTLDELGFTTEWDRFTDTTPYGQKNFRNLIATFDSTAPRRLTLACHYDSKIMSGYDFIGATDSALPCALLLDLAATLGPLMYKRSNKEIALQLLFLDGEEAFVNWTPKDSIYGARHLASTWEHKWFPSSDGANFNLNKELERMDVFVLLDLLGAKNPQISNYYGLGAELLFPELPKIESNLRRLNCLKPIRQIFNDRISYANVEDDHIPFVQKGVRVLHLISAPFPSVWHTRNDDASALDNDTIENLASIMRVFVAKYLAIVP